MKAVVCTRYGPPEVLQVRDIPKPVPCDNEILIKVQATTVTKYDTWQRSATAPPGFGLISRIATGITKPKQPILGTELSGEIEAVGGGVTRFKAGDQIIAFNGMDLGTYAEYLCMKEDGAIAVKPQNLTWEEAATMLQGPLTALYFLRNGHIQNGQKVLVYGASGGVGLPAVQIARSLGTEVTGVCSTSKVELVKSLGADKVIDYTREDFTKEGQIYDIVLDTMGKSPVSGGEKVLKKGGYYLFTTFGLLKLLRIQMFSLTSGRKIVIGALKERAEDIVFLNGLIEAGNLRPVVDRVYPMEQAAEAHRYVETGQKKGNVVISMDNRP